MSAEDLELVSTRELIDELMRRTSFVGIVVHAAVSAHNRAPERDGQEPDEGAGRVFKVHFNANLDAERAGRLLGVVGDYMTNAGDLY